MIEKYPGLGVPNQFFMSFVGGARGHLADRKHRCDCIYLCIHGSLATDIRKVKQSSVPKWGSRGDGWKIRGNIIDR